MYVAGTTEKHSPELAMGELQILGLVSASVVNTGDYKPMDHAPMLHGGGSTDDQCAHGKRERNGVTQRCPTSRAGAFAAREGRGRRAIQISRDKRGSGIILHGGNGTKSLTRSSISRLVSRIHAIHPNEPHSRPCTVYPSREVSPETHLP